VSLSGSLVENLHARVPAGFGGIQIAEPSPIAGERSPQPATVDSDAVCANLLRVAAQRTGVGTVRA
jgi:hypothetical protein